MKAGAQLALLPGLDGVDFHGSAKPAFRKGVKA